MPETTVYFCLFRETHMIVRKCSLSVGGWMLSLAMVAMFCGCDAKVERESAPPSVAKTPNSTSESPPVEKAASTSETKEKPATTAVAKEEDEEPAADVPFKLGDLIEPFTPPSLEELEKQVKWRDRPILDSLQRLRERQANEKPLATVPEALKLKNKSSQDNDRILSAMGRLPANDQEVNWDATVNRHSAGDVNSLVPILASSVAEFEVIELISFGLFGFDWNFEKYGSKDSIVSWQTSEDKLYDKVVLRDDLTWSDGTPITAHDVKFSFQTIMTKAVPVKAERTATRKLKWVEAYDDRTVVFFHKDSLATNDQNINFSILPKHIYEHTIAQDPLLKVIPAHIEQNEKPVVGGPYVVAQRVPNSHILLERRESYYMHKGKQVRDRPYFKTIRLRITADDSTSLLALKAGDLDEMILTPEQWQNSTNDDEFYKLNTKVYATEWTSFHFIWNCEDPRFSDKRVRWAMTYAFDHKELLDKLLYGMCEACTGNFHPTSKWAPKPAPQPIQQDLDKAEALLDEAGWTDSDGDGVRDKKIDGKKVDFEFTLLSSNRADRIAICNLMKESLAQIGVRCNVKAMEFTVLIDALSNHKFQGAFGGWGTGTDPDTSENVYASNQERNYGGYKNPKVDELFVKGRHELDAEKRPAIYRELSQELWNDQPYTWLYYRNAFYGFNKSLRGYTFSPRGPYNFGPGFGSIYKPAQY